VPITELVDEGPGHDKGEGDGTGTVDVGLTPEPA
jgi:hypothetical protein